MKPSVVHLHHGWYTVYTRMVRARAWKSGAFCVVLDSPVPPHGWSALRLDLVPCEWTPESVWLKERLMFDLILIHINLGLDWCKRKLTDQTTEVLKP